MNDSTPAPTLILLTLLSGVLYVLLLPPWSLSGLAWLALAPLFVAAVRARPLAAAALGLLWTCVATAGIAWWFPQMLERFFGASALEAWASLLGLGLLINGLPYAFAAAALSFAAHRGVLGPALAAVLFVGAEWLRAHGLVPNPFAQIAYSQYGTPFAQSVDLVGPYGLALLLASVNALIAGAFEPRLRGAHPRRATALVSLCVIGALAYGSWRLGTDFGEGEPVPVALVQCAVTRQPDWHVRSDPKQRAANLDRYLALTARAARAGPELVFWPEFAVDFYLDEASVARARLFDGVRSAGADLVLGGSRHEHAPAGDTRYYNSVFVVDRQGALQRARYDKRRLVPFAEYGPLGSWLRAGSAVYASGDAPRILATRAARIGAFICGEALHPEPARELSREGAEILANPSNDYWFGHPNGARHQFEVASFRAIENRRYLVRATATGISALVDPLGRPLVQSEGEGPEVLATEIRRSTVTTPYQMLGERPLALLAILVLAGACLRTTRRDELGHGERR